MKKIGWFALPLIWSVGCCVRFTDLAVGTTYNVGDTVTTQGREIVVERFQRGGGTWTDSGKAEVYDRNWARGSGPDMGTGRTNLKFLFDYPLSKLTLKFGEFGENVNIKINGDFRNTGDFMDLNGTTVGGVLVTVQAQFDGHNWYGELILTGTINDFSIGGVELWIDDVCPTR